MSRGKKSKRKMSGKRKKEVAVVTTAMRLSDVDGSVNLIKNPIQNVDSSCFCCYRSPPSINYTKPKTERRNDLTAKIFSKVFPNDDTEATLSHLAGLFDEIVNRYRGTWARDRELGYPDFRGGHTDSMTPIDDLANLRREEIARLNTILPKLEESYLQKLENCWASLVAKMRRTAMNDRKKFIENVTSVQIQLLTHEVYKISSEDSLNFHSDDDQLPNKDTLKNLELNYLRNGETNSPKFLRILEEPFINEKDNLSCTKVSLNFR